jgi:hypothetical protein
MSWAKFWAIFYQTHPVTLAAHKKFSKVGSGLLLHKLFFPNTFTTPAPIQTDKKVLSYINGIIYVTLFMALSYYHMTYLCMSLYPISFSLTSMAELPWSSHPTSKRAIQGRIPQGYK